jgi:hypothetical protein
MKPQRAFRAFRSFSLALTVLVLACLVCPDSIAQGPLPTESAPPSEAFSIIRTSRPETSAPHKFWDKKNVVLFAATAALNGADFAVTRANLQSGGNELNPVVRVFGRSTIGLAVNSGGQTLGVIGISYLFHKTGHHRLERIISIVNIGASGAAVGYGISHR